MPKPPKGMFKRGPSWFVRDRRGGRDKWICLGRDFQEASRKYRRFKQGDAPLSDSSVRDAVERWLSTYVRVHRNEKNQQLARQRATTYLSEFMGYKPVSRVTPDDLRQYRIWLEGRELSVQTVAHVLSDARCFFLWCADSGLAAGSPVPRRLLPRIQERVPDRLNAEEVELVTALPYPLGFLCRFGLASGLRWSELCRARVEDVRNGVLTVQQTKSGRIRRVPLPPSFLAELQSRVGKIVPYATASSGSVKRDIRKKTGIARFHPHQLRHTFACLWLERGGSLPALQQLLGHASIVTTQRYARLNDEAVQREACRVHLVDETVDAVS